MPRRKKSINLRRTRQAFSRFIDASVEVLESRMLLSAAAAPALAGLFAYPNVIDASAPADSASTTVRVATSGGVTPATVSEVSPSQMRTAYGVNLISFSGTAGTGAGQTIAIIDAYNNPNIISDANTFSSTYGLQQFNVSGGPTFQVVNENGGTTLPANATGNWDLEEALDVEWAHVIAPQANIILFEANSSAYSDLFNAVQTAEGTAGVSVISMSFSGAEFASEPYYDPIFASSSASAGITFLASTGDSGAPGGFPATSSNVIAVGGTTLNINSDGSYNSESGWSGSGGGVSAYEPQPAYQSGKVNGVSSTYRSTPDVSIDADPASGVAVLDTYAGGWHEVGGTSLACPMWAGLVSIADQGLALKGDPSLDGPSQTLPMLYNLPSSDFHDVTTGSNGHAATTGYDLVTGLGSPAANLLVPDLVSKFPAISGPSTGTVNQNSSLTFSSSNSNAISATDGFAATNAEQLTLSVSHGQLTLASGSGVTVAGGANNSSSVTVQGTLTQIANALNGMVYTPTSGFSGTDSLSLSYVDTIGGGNLTAAATIAITVASSGNQAPAITSSSSASFTSGSAGTFTLTATGSPSPTLGESGSLPTGISFNSSTGALSGTPGAGTGGTYNLTFTASNGVGQQASQNFTLTIDQAPAITSANHATFTAGSSGTFTVNATGFPAATLGETGTLPSGLTFNTTTGVLSGTPGAGTGGTYSLTFTANNGIGQQASQSFTLTVDQAPAITSANQATFTTGSAGSFTVTASGFPAETYGETGTLPSGLTFNTTTGVLSGTPAAGTGGTCSLTFTANNGIGQQASQSFTLTVDQAPAITSVNHATFTVGSAGSFTVTASGFPAATFGETGTLPSGLAFNTATGILSGAPAAGTGGTYSLTVTANNGIGQQASQGFTLTVDQAAAITSASLTTFTTGSAGSFTVTASGFPAATFGETGTLPSGVAFNATTGILSGTPGGATGGTYNLTFTANNGIGQQASQSFTLTIDQAAAITSANHATFTVGSAGSLTVTATGFPAATLGESGALPTGVTFNSTTGVLSGTPAAGTGGTYNLTLTANNGVGQQASQSFALTVNQAPAITSASQTTFTTGSAGSFTVTATGFPAESFSESGALPNGLAFNTTTGVLSGTPAAGTGGTYNLTFMASNGVGQQASQSFTLTVDQAPAITSASQATFTVASAGNFTATASGFPAATLGESGALPSGVTFNPSTGVLSGTPAAGTGGAYNLTLTANNGIGQQANQNFTLTVNQAPAITSANQTTFTAGNAGTFTVTATGFSAVTLGESGALPSGVAFNSSSGVLSGTPAAGTGGTYNLVFTANNGVGQQASQNFTLTIDQAPAITSTNRATFTTGSAGSFTVTASGFPAETFGETGTLPSGLAFNATTGVLNGTPAAGTGGTYNLTFTADNGVGQQASQNFTLTVNQAPAVTSANNATFTVGSAGSFTVTAGGFPAASFGESGTLPSGLTFDAATGVLSGTPGMASSGSYPLTFTATNGIGQQASQSFTLTVNPLPPSQLVFLPVPASGTAGKALSSAVKVQVEDQFGDVITSDNSMVTLAPSSGLLGGAVPSVSAQAVHGVATFTGLAFVTAGSQTLTASDGSLAAAISSAINVIPAAAGKLALLQVPQSGTAGQALSPGLQVAVEDPFGNIIAANISTVTISVSSGPGRFATGSSLTAKAVNGIATFSNLILDTAGNYTLAFTDGTMTRATSGSVAVSPAQASKLALLGTLTTATAGQALSPSLSVAVEDRFGNVVTGDASTVTVVVHSGPAGFSGGSTTQVAASNGLAGFNQLILNTSGSYTLSASDGSLTGVTSHSFTVNPAAANKLVLQLAPSSGTAGVALSPSMKVAVEDVFGNVVTTFASAVGLTVQQGPAGFASGSTTSVKAVHGVASFTNALLDQAGNYVIGVGSGSLLGTASGTIAVNPAGASKLMLLQSPGAVVAGQPISPAMLVAVEDRFGNVVTTNSSMVSLTVHTGPGSFAAGSTTAVAAQNGVATFNNVILTKTGAYTLSAADGALTHATTGNVSVSPAAASQLAFVSAPTAAIAGVAFSPTVKVAVEDQFGNLETADNSTVTLSLGSGVFAGGATLTTQAVNGNAMFTNVVVDAAGSNGLVASDGSLASANSKAITVKPAAAAELSFLQSPSAVVANQVLNPSVQVAVEDAFGNIVTTNKSVVTLSVLNGPGSFTNKSTTSVAANGGIATFSNLIFDTSGTYTFAAHAGSLAPAATSAVAVTDAQTVGDVVASSSSGDPSDSGPGPDFAALDEFFRQTLGAVG